MAVGHLAGMMIVAVGIVFAASGGKAASRETIIAQLSAQGYREIRVSRTWLGRLRFIATGPSGTREIVLNPSSGDIMRDYAAPLDKTTERQGVPTSPRQTLAPNIDGTAGNPAAAAGVASPDLSGAGQDGKNSEGGADPGQASVDKGLGTTSSGPGDKGADRGKSGKSSVEAVDSGARDIGGKGKGRDKESGNSKASGSGGNGKDKSGGGSDKGNSAGGKSDKGRGADNGKSDRGKNKD